MIVWFVLLWNVRYSSTRMMLKCISPKSLEGKNIREQLHAKAQSARNRAMLRKAGEILATFFQEFSTERKMVDVKGVMLSFSKKIKICQRVIRYTVKLKRARIEALSKLLPSLLLLFLPFLYLIRIHIYAYTC